MRIHSISDVITNSSNETFITTHKPDPEVYDYSYAEELTWKDIINYGTCDFDPDLMIYVLEERLLDHKLLQNPFPRTKEIDTPWQQAEYCGWTVEELKDIWVLFIELNKEDFKKLVGLCYVSGPEDNQYNDYDQWVSNNEDLDSISILRAGRDQDFF